MLCPYTVTKRGTENAKATKKTNVGAKCFLADSLHKNWKHYLLGSYQKTLTIMNHQHLHALHNGIPCVMRFPSPISSSEATAPFVLCIHGHGRLRKETLDHGIVAFAGCHEQRCFASGAAARGQATGRTQRNEGEKIRRNLGRLKSRSFGNCGHSKSLWFWRCFDDIELAEKAMWTRLAVKMLCRNSKNVPSPREQICARLGHNRIWKQSPTVGIACNRVRGLVRTLTGKKHKFLRFVRTANNDPVKQCLITVYIRMDTPEPQKQFGLWWACHSVSRLKSMMQRDSDPKCRNNIVVLTNNNTKHWCKCLDTLSKQIKQYPPKSGTISEPSTSSFTSQRNPKASWGFTPISSSEATAVFVLLRVHSRLRLQEPLDHGIVAVQGCQVQRCSASGGRSPRPSRRRNPKERRGENSEKTWAPQKSKFWKLWPLKNPRWT